jgi:GDPmannose 4,6-dehydratase
MDIMNIADVSEILSTLKNEKKVFITGVTGQDGSHMVDYLLKNTDCMIFGGARRLSIKNHENLKHLSNEPRFKLVNFDLSDSHSINKILETIVPDYFINLAAQTFVGSSWDFPSQTWECNTTAVIHILEAIKLYNPECRFYNAGSSEEYGNVQYIPQDENHPSKPRSPYGASKSAARQLVKVYRESYNLYAIQGLLFNHEGTRRGEEFVTRKITKGIARIKKSIENHETFDPIELGNVDAQRDWSDAEDFVDGIWKMLNQEIYNENFTSYRPIPSSELKEYVLSSNETHTIREFVEKSFKVADINGKWHGERVNAEFSISKEDKEKYDVKSSTLVKINPKFYRPAEVDLLLGDSTLARRELKWFPKVSFEKLIEKMVLNDLNER